MVTVSHGHTSPLSWQEFAAEVDAILDAPSQDIDPNAYLVEDLGADSVALAEIITFLLLDCGMKSLADDLDRRDWNGVTIGQIYDEYSAEVAGS